MKQLEIQFFNLLDSYQSGVFRLETQAVKQSLENDHDTSSVDILLGEMDGIGQALRDLIMNSNLDDETQNLCFECAKAVTKLAMTRIAVRDAFYGT